MDDKKKTKVLSDGAIIGRALTKLQALDAAEQAELAQSPAVIKAKFAEKRTALLGELSPTVRAAVVAADKAASEASKAAAE